MKKFEFTVREALEMQFNRTFDKDAIAFQELIDESQEDPGLMRSVEYLFDKFNKQVNKALSHLHGIKNYDEKEMKKRFMGVREHPWMEEDSFFPIPVYVSSSPEDKNTIGLLVFEDGTVEMFEGNDEATPETVEMVNKALGLDNKWQKVYGSHGEKVVSQIQGTMELPIGLYVSPSMGYASGFWGKDRVMFSCWVEMSCLSQESDLDWKVIKQCPVKGFRLG